MSLDTRCSSALFKRAEQLKRWEESDTNREPVTPKHKSRKIKFSSGCVFLAACSAGDKDEVLKLLERGADINTANVDGLTALHQACIDDNLDMVEFLVEHGADVNRGDNEGWTPLHATASCGFLSIAKYLIEKSAQVAAVNNDGELAIDIVECQKMKDLLKEEIETRGIDCKAARNEEENVMLKDAKEWLSTNSSLVHTKHPKNGATALHVAAAKGYVEVMKIIIQCGANLDAQDVDGWTALHAASHWGQKEACQLLAENFADMESKNCVGQTAFDLSDPEMGSYLEDLKKKRQAKKRPEVQSRPLEAETPSKVKKVELEITEKEELKNNETIEKKNRVNSLTNDTTISISNKDVDASRLPPTVPAKQIVDSNAEDNPPWRKPYVRPTKELGSPIKNTPSFKENRISSTDTHNENEVTLRRANSFSNDDEYNAKYKTLHERIQAYKNSAVIPYSTRPKSEPTFLSASQQHYRKQEKNDVVSLSTTLESTSSPTKTGSPTTPTSNLPARRSFVPPVRDEESETQRKAHAKRVRETRRSTQGVTLEEIKSAEQFVKKTNNNNNNETTPTTTLGANGDSSNGVSVTATITTGAPTVLTREPEEPTITHERRPSWRLQVENGSSKFKLEDATKPSDLPTTQYIRRTNNTTPTAQRPSSVPLETADATITLPLRRPKSLEEKENDKENDVRNAQGQGTLATQAAIQRRRRPKRRSTGVVSFDNVDDLDQDNKDPAAGGDYDDATKLNHQDISGTDRSSRSRLGSTSDIRNENGEIDYKKLYEQQLVENDRLKEKLRKSDEELRETKQTLERINVVTSKNSLTELEKREKRAMERKLSEMEEELKQLQKLKAENERLKSDNKSLTRVINKLTNSSKQ